MSKETKIGICEVYKAVQGEGVNLGVPSMFLRLLGCNLQCDWLGFGCDTPYTWKKGAITSDDVNVLTIEKAAELLQDPTEHWVITGGEPMLQQEALIELIKMYNKKNKTKVSIEIETNGTIKPLRKLDKLVQQYNVSVKLSNSMGKRGWNTKERRINKDAINFFRKSKKANFKFVVQTETDMKEILELQKEFSIQNKKILLMPEGVTEEAMKVRTPGVMNYCIKYGFRFTPRLHILVFGLKRKV